MFSVGQLSIKVDADGKPKVHLPPPTVLTSLPPIGGAGPVPPPTASTGSPPETKKPMLDESLEDGRELPLPPGDSEDTERDVAIKGGGARLAVMKKLMRTKTREQCVMILRYGHIE